MEIIKRIIYLFFLSLSAYGFLPHIDLIDYEQKKKNKLELLTNYQIEEVENDKVQGAKEIDIQKQTVAFDYQFLLGRNLSFGGSQKVSKVRSNLYSENVIDDPSFYLWWKLRESQSVYKTTRELGVDFSPDFTSNNIFKDKNGSLFALKYRFGLEDDKSQAKVTYLVGLKEGGRFNQKNQSYKYPSNFFVGISLLYGIYLTEKIHLEMQGTAVKNSQNQAQIFYQSNDKDLSWLTEINLSIGYKWRENLWGRIGYKSQNESSGFGKMGRKYDYEHDSNQAYITLSQRF